MSHEEINLIIQKNRQSGGVFNGYKILKSIAESEDEDSEINDTNNHLNQIKQEVNTLEFEPDADDNSNILNSNDNPINDKAFKPSKEAIEQLKEEVMMSMPDDDSV